MAMELRSKDQTMSSGNKGKGRGAPRTNHDRITPSDGSLSGQASRTWRLDEAEKKAIVTEVTAAVMAGFRSVFRDEFATVEDHLQSAMSEHGVGLQAICYDNADDPPVYFGDKQDPSSSAEWNYRR